MAKLKKSIYFETAFNLYSVNETLGEGGAGRVYGGSDSNGARVAIKVLTSTSSDKRQRFQREITFLQRNSHQNIIRVTDYGIIEESGIKRPFYVMPRCTGSLRAILDPATDGDRLLADFSQILDGIEAAHLQGVIHRDLKPENILVAGDEGRLLVADFGVARFNEDALRSAFQTPAGTRLANFQYAAPEQRVAGSEIGPQADIYALGLILNEMFTGHVPHGTGYVAIAATKPEFSFLDPVVEKMIRQNPSDRFGSLVEVKSAIARYRSEAITMQRLSEIEKKVIPVGAIDEPLAIRPPKIIDAEWSDRQLRIKLDQPVNGGWISALHNIGNYSSLMGKGPEYFKFQGDVAIVEAMDGQAQAVLDHFKNWLPRATQVYRERLEADARRKEQQAIERLARERAAEEKRLQVNKVLKF
jgi:serine/threonine protein kinase